MAEKSRSRRRLARGREGILESDALAAPLPGSMLVLLSHLHRSEITRLDDEDRTA